MLSLGILLAFIFLTAIDTETLASECGTVAAVGTPAIVNGLPAKYGPFPWHVGVYQQTRKGVYEQICGGTLVGKDLVVSAAHCFYDETRDKVEDANKFRIAGGKYYRSYNEVEPYVQKSSVKTIDIPVRFLGRSGNYAQDIALIRLETPFNITELVKPVCMDWANTRESELLRAGNNGKIMGWGLTETGESSNSLREISLPFIPHEACSTIVSLSFRPFVSTEDKFCAGYLNGSSVCLGDSGGGLCFESNGLWYLRGIVSLIPSSGDVDLLCDHYQYAAFTNVSHFRGWIHAAYDNAEIGCILPEHPIGGTFERLSCEGSCSDLPGFRIPVSSKLRYRCNNGYFRRGNYVAVCNDNGWNSLATCSECGRAREVANVSHEGSTYQSGRYPWQVEISWRLVNQHHLGANCIGTLISPDMILTGADGILKSNGIIEYTDIVIRAGYLYDFNEKNSHWTQELSIGMFNATGRHNSLTFLSNVGLLRLATPFVVTDFVMPICFDWGNSLVADQLRRGSIGKFYVLPSPEEESLRRADIKLEYVPREDCLAIDRASLESRLPAGKFCARDANEPHLDLCSIMNGGGSVQFQSDGIWYMRGIMTACFKHMDVSHLIFLDVGIGRENIRAAYEDN